MDRCQTRRKRGYLKTRNGNALVWVIVIVIVAVSVVTIGQKYFGWGSPGDPEECPWLQEDRIVGFGESVTLPTPPKTELNIWSSFRVNPVHEGKERGTLKIEVSEEGLVSGSWNAEYDEGKRTYTFNAGMDGNIDVSKTYTDENGNEDPSLLYIFAAGKYTKQVYSKSSPSGAGGGDAHLVGWLSPDGKAHGKIFLSFDKKVRNILTWEK